MKDITDRRDGERRYRRERDFNKNILNNTQSMILVLDTAGLISYANRRCFEAGYWNRNCWDIRWYEMVPAARRPLLAEALERTLQGAALDNLEIPLFRGSGAPGQFSISLSPMRDEEGEINSVVVVMTDITDAASLQAKLMHTEKMAALGQLVSGVAHEVNNPLAAIVGFTDLLLENPAVPDEAKEELQVILQEAQSTRVIVQNLLSFARQMPAQREPAAGEPVLRQTMKLRAYDFSNHGVELIEKYAAEISHSYGRSAPAAAGVLEHPEQRLRRGAGNAPKRKDRDPRRSIAPAKSKSYFETTGQASRILTASSIHFSPPRKSAREPDWG